MNIQVEVSKKETEAAIKLADRFVEITIANTDEYEMAACDLKGIKTKARELDEHRKNITKPLDEAKAQIMALFKIPLDRLAQAETAIKNAMLGWQAKLEAIRRAEEDRMREIQRQAEERIRAEAEAQRAKELELCKKAEAALAAGNQKKAEALIAKAEAASQLADTKELTVQTLAAATPTVVSTLTKPSGIKTRTMWDFDIIDESQIPREFLTVDRKKLGQYATAMKGSAKVAGVKFFSHDIIAA